MKWMICFMFLFLFPLVSSSSVLESETIEVEIVQEGILRTNNVLSLTLGLSFYPLSDYYSDVLSIDTDPSSNFVNNAYIFNWRLPDPRISYSLTSRVSNTFSMKKINSKVIFPFEVPFEYIKYTKPSSYCDSENLEIRKLANSLAKGEDDAYKILFKLSKWVNTNIEYDLRYADDLLKASDVLLVRKGTCNEITTLFIALARALNLPVRYISGYSYGTYGEEGFENHAWSEAWLPEYGWIPVDPTYGEFGWLDVSHIKGQVTENPGQSAINYRWVNGQVYLEEVENNVEILSKSGKLPEFLIGELYMEEENVYPGSCNIIWMNVTNPTDFYISTSVSLNVTPKLLSKNEQMILVEPYGSTKVGWVIEFGKDFNPNFIYTYSIDSNSFLMKTTRTESKVSFSGEKLDMLYCSALVSVEESTSTKINKNPDVNATVIVPKRVKLGDTYVIEIFMHNLGKYPAEDVIICLSGECIQEYLGINEKKSIYFERKATSLGNTSLRILFENVNLAAESIPLEVVQKPIIEKFIDLIKSIFKLN